MSKNPIQEKNQKDKHHEDTNMKDDTQNDQ